MLQFHKEKDAACTIAMLEVPWEEASRFGLMFTDDDGRITAFEEKPKLSYFINTGMYIVNLDALDEIPEDTFFNATDLIEKLITQGKRVIRYPLNGMWIDIGTHQEYEMAKELVKHLK